MLLPKPKFFRYQSIYHRTIMRSPILVTLRVVSVGNNDGTIEDFVGSSDRTFTDYQVHALYIYSTLAFERSPTGYTDDVSATVFMSPIELASKLGSFRLDRKRTKVFFKGQESAIQELEYMEPIYDSCIAVRVQLEEVVRG